MKGIIFNLLEDFITTNFGEDTYETIYESTRLKTTTPFIGPGTYPDEDLLALVTKTCEHLNLKPSDALQAFGKFCMPRLIAKFPYFAHERKTAKDFLKSVDSIIHVEVKKLFKDAEPPKFTYQDPAPNKLIMEYHSKRNLCALVEGLVNGLAEHYRIAIDQKQTKCVHTGADRCEFEFTFDNKPA